MNRAKTILGNRYSIPILVVGAVTLLIGSTYGISRVISSTRADTSEPALQTARARLGDLSVTASGEGSLAAANEIRLGFGASGPIAELRVQVGDGVNAGDVLAVQGNQDELQAAIAADELAVLEAQRALDEVEQGADLLRAQALLDLADAQDALKTAQRNWQVSQSGNRASDTSIKASQAEVVVAKEAMERAKSKYDKTSGDFEEDAAKAQSYKDYAAAVQRYQSALISYNWYTGKPSEIEQAQLDAELALAQAQVKAAELALQRVQDGPDVDTLKAAQLGLDRAQANLAVSKENLDLAVLRAPVSGTITAIDAEVGETVSQAFITLVDLDHPRLEVYLDETDLDKVNTGYDLEATFDAIPDLVFTGSVIQLDPTLTTTGGASMIHAVAELDDPPPDFSGRLMIGMSAAVDVIAGEATNAVLIPVEALREISPAQYAVFVVEDGEPVLRFVQVGLQDVTSAEITSGLEAGELVSTGIVEIQG